MIKLRMEGRNVLFKDALNTIYLIIWNWTFGEGPQKCEREPTPATSWATLSELQQGIFSYNFFLHQ